MMDTVQSIPQPVVARVHALATAAGCQLVATCDLAVGGAVGVVRHPRRQGWAVLPHAARRRGPQHRPQAGARDGAHRRSDRRLDRRRVGPDQSSGARRRTRRRRARPDHPGDAGQRAVEGARASVASTTRSASTSRRRTRWRASAWRRPRWSPTRRRRSRRSSTSATRRSSRVRTTGHRRPSTDRLAPTVTPRAPRRGCVTRHVRGDCGSCGWSRPVRPR